MSGDACIQSITEQWWIKDESRNIERGRLIWAFLPHIDQQPMILVPEDRGKDPTNHYNPTYKIVAMDIGRPYPPPKLPVASFPNFYEEKRTVYRAKKRPALIVCSGGELIEKRLTIGGAKFLRSQTVIVAPYYGGDQDGSRGGYPPEFLSRIRLCHYPQFVCESLPNSGKTKQSVLRLDHIQPVGRDRRTIECTEWKLSDEALIYLDDWISWLFSKMPEPAGSLKAARDLLHEQT